MQIKLESLQEHINKEISPLYIIHGDEILLSQEAADNIRQKARELNYTQRTIYTVSGAHFDWRQIINEVMSQSLFSEKQIIEIRIPSGKPGKEGSNALQKIADSVPNLNNTSVIIITLPYLDKATKSASWFTALDNAGITIAIQNITINTLPSWINNRLEKQNQYIEKTHEGQSALQFFANHVEGNLLAAHQEIQKLSLLYPAGEIKAKDIYQSISNVARYDVFQLSQTILSGQRAKVEQIISGLKSEGVAEVLTHYAISQEIRTIAKIHNQVNAVYSLNMALKENRIWGEKAILYERIIRKINSKQIAQMLQAAYQTDLIVKGIPVEGWPQNPWQALNKLAQSFCGVCAS